MSPTRRQSLTLLAAAVAAGAASSAEPLSVSAATAAPIVLVHGFLGFDDVAVLRYFLGIPGLLRQHGATVLTPNLSAVNSNEARGDQLLAFLARWREASGGTKVNLIGHSQGGTTARYAASLMPEWVSSVTTIGTPHTGSPVADALLRADAVPGVNVALEAVLKALGHALALLSGKPANPQQARAALRSLGSAGAAVFNAQHPMGEPGTVAADDPVAANGVRYWSIGSAVNPQRASKWLDPLFLAGRAYFGQAPNDGVVGQAASRWGHVLRDDFDWNHLEQINHGWFKPTTGPGAASVYLDHAKRLKNLGL